MTVRNSMIVSIIDVSLFLIGFYVRFLLMYTIEVTLYNNVISNFGFSTLSPKAVNNKSVI